MDHTMQRTTIMQWVEDTARGLSSEGEFGQVKVVAGTPEELRLEIHMTSRHGAGVVIGRGGETVAMIRSLAQKMALGIKPSLTVEIVVANIDGDGQSMAADVRDQAAPAARKPSYGRY